MQVLIRPVMHDSTWTHGLIDIVCTLDDLPFVYIPCVNGVVKRSLVLKDASYYAVYKRLYGKLPTSGEEERRDAVLHEKKHIIIQNCLHVALRLYPALTIRP
jgi:hypothetical protein